MAGFADKYFWWLPVGSVPEVTAQELQREINRTRDKPQLLDVRTSAEWQQGIIKGALLVPVGVLKSRAATLPFDRSKPVVAICRTAHRSISAVRILRNAGYENVRQLQGGMLNWQGRNYPVVQPR